MLIKGLNEERPKNDSGGRMLTHANRRGCRSNAPANAGSYRSPAIHRARRALRGTSTKLPERRTTLYWSGLAQQRYAKSHRSLPLRAFRSKKTQGLANGSKKGSFFRRRRPSPSIQVQWRLWQRQVKSLVYLETISRFTRFRREEFERLRA
jgi:hypothetical protein